jgi:hypothetical protein
LRFRLTLRMTSLLTKKAREGGYLSRRSLKLKSSRAVSKTRKR